MRSLMRQSGSRTLHLANCPHFSSSVEQAVTVSGPSIAWMMSATEIARRRLATARSRRACPGARSAGRAAPAAAAPSPSARSGMSYCSAISRALADASVGSRGEVLHRHQRVVGFFGESQHQVSPHARVAASPRPTCDPSSSRLPHHVDLRVGDAGDAPSPSRRPGRAATAPPDSRARSASW